MALMGLNGKISYLVELEFSRRVARDCCVQVEGNWYSVPVALVRQNVTVQIRDQAGADSSGRPDRGAP
jgi:hypothetical protein